MSTVQLQSHKTIQRLVDWRWTRGGWQSGNVRIVPFLRQPHGWTGWRVKLRVGGRWRWACSSQRQYCYGCPGSAKRGVSKWKNIVFKRVG